MALNIKNAEVERLATEVAAMAHETKTEAIRRALEDRRQRLAIHRVDTDKLERLMQFFRTEIWPNVPEDQLGKPPMSREEEDAVLGYGPGGFCE
jgi:antitoxin VapB